MGDEDPATDPQCRDIALPNRFIRQRAGDSQQLGNLLNRVDRSLFYFCGSQTDLLVVLFDMIGAASYASVTIRQARQ
jgi:hypothetical protein